MDRRNHDPIEIPAELDGLVKQLDRLQTRAKTWMRQAEKRGGHDRVHDAPLLIVKLHNLITEDVGPLAEKFIKVAQIVPLNGTVAERIEELKHTVALMVITLDDPVAAAKVAPGRYGYGIGGDWESEAAKQLQVLIATVHEQSRRALSAMYVARSKQRNPKSSRKLGASLKAVLGSNEAYQILDAHPEIAGTTWTSGGCPVLAVALLRWDPKLQLVGIRDRGTVHHVLVTDGKYFYDADGASGKKQLLRRWIRDEFLEDPQIVQLEHVNLPGLKCPIEAVHELQQLIMSAIGSPSQNPRKSAAELGLTEEQLRQQIQLADEVMEEIVFEERVRAEELETLRTKLVAEHPLRTLHLHELSDGSAVRVDTIRIEPAARGEGHGSAVMEEIVDWADEHGKILVLTPSPDFDVPERRRERDKKRLQRFYSRFGFVPNKGRRKDYRFTDTMIRMPKSAKKNPSHLTVVRVTPTKWTGSLGPREAYFVFHGSRLVDVVQEDAEDITTMLAKGYSRDADLEVSVRPAEYRKLLAKGPPGNHRNPGGCPTWAIQAFVNDKLDEGWVVPARGGLADALPARRFRLNSLVQGTCVELEHTTDWETALGIAMDHLAEAEDYYVRLATIEPQHNPAKIEYRMARALNPFRPSRTEATSNVRLRNLARRLGRGEC